MMPALVNSLHRSESCHPLEYDINQMDGSNILLNKSSGSSTEFIFCPVPTKNAVENRENISFNENTSSSENFFPFGITKEQTENQDINDANAFDSMKECLDFGDPRPIILKSMRIFLGNNLQEIRNCIKNLEEFQNEDVALKNYATLLAAFIQEKYDKSFADFKEFSDEEISIFCKKNLYKEKIEFLKKSINILPHFISEINEKIDRDGTPVRPAMGFFNQVIEAFFGFSLIMINIATILEPVLSLFCMYFSIVIGLFLFIVRINFAIKIFNFEQKGTGSLLPINGIQDIKNCIPSIEKYSNLGEGALIEKYYQFKKKLLTFLSEVLNNQMKMRSKLKYFNVNFSNHQKSVEAEFKGINKSQEDTNECLRRLSENVESLVTHNGGSSSHPGTPLPVYCQQHPLDRRSSTPFSSGRSSPVLGRGVPSAENNYFTDHNPNFNSIFHTSLDRKRKFSSSSPCPSPLASVPQGQSLWVYNSRGPTD